ncbi:MAG: glycosyl hydrolase family 17 [Saprospiraceae bacterium]|nr:glycosyl hydrolase family 17 [Saprospiraceae bacterium]
MLVTGCGEAAHKTISKKEITAQQILGNPDYQAISYGGYRHATRDSQPSLEDLKEDMKLLSALNIKLLRTYNVHYPQAANLLKAIDALKQEDNNFEMYVMLGAWIDCKDAFTDNPDHSKESERNATEIEKAVELANSYPDIVKIIGVGNEAMVKWATSYYVQAGVILKWVNHLQKLKAEGQLGQEVWITCSDNFASWGGGTAEYHTKDLRQLMHAVDYISMHTYPMHDTHYNPEFWKLEASAEAWSKEAKIDTVMARAVRYAKMQYASVVNYMKTNGIDKAVHIGETGWASYSNYLFGEDGSGACDEIKQSRYYHDLRQWTNDSGISCFFFEAFDEPWKDAANPGGSENHFGLFTVTGEAKYVIWDEVDSGAFDGLYRNGNAISKTWEGDLNKVMKASIIPPMK